MENGLDLNMPDLDSFFDVEVDPNAAKWETLIDQIIEGNVIPVIGGDILMDDFNLEQRLIKQWAQNCGITSNPTNFSELLYDEKFKNRENIYFWLNSFCKNNSSKLKPSSLLKRILSIKQFPFVITTSYFPIVENAMREIWGERKVKTMIFSNNPATTRQKGLGDITSESDISLPTVYYMFGKVCNSAHRYVVTDTDMLSFCSAWLSSESRPPVLSSVIKDKYLLVLGNNYPDWLFRFIWYSMNLTDNLRDPFSKIQGMMVNENADDTLVKFLNRIDTFTHKDPLYVINTIERKLEERKSEIEAHRFDKPQKDCDIFISYSRTDSNIAAKLYETLTSEGLNVWYDKAKLKTGADWMESIEQAIETSRVFIPILSSCLNDERNDFHVYRKEWKIADRRAEGYSRRYILPIAAKNIDYYNADLPKSFKTANAAYYDEKDPNFSSFAKEVLEIINNI